MELKYNKLQANSTKMLYFTILTKDKSSPLNISFKNFKY